MNSRQIRSICSLLCFTLMITSASKVLAETSSAGEEYTNTYENKTLKARGRVLNGKMQGTWTRWYPNGKVESVGTWVNDEPDGHWTFWYVNGQKNAEGEMSHGKRVGEWTFWDTDGNSRQANLTNGWRARFDWKQIRGDFDYFGQNSSGSLLTVGATWAPRFKWKDLWNWQGILGLIPAKSSGGSYFGIYDIEWLASYGPFDKHQLILEFGGGIQYWSMTSTAPLALSINISSLEFDRKKYGRPFAGLTLVQYPSGDQTIEYRIGSYWAF